MDGNKAINDARKEERKPAISRAVRQKKKWRGEWNERRSKAPGRKERRRGAKEIQEEQGGGGRTKEAC